MKWILQIIVISSSISLFAQTNNKAFVPGELWLDHNGVHINAHGGGFLYHNESYYWFGEHKISGALGNKAMVGIHVYSSTDLYNWKDQGIALEIHDNLKSKLVKGSILERPKVIYNKKTEKFVMWFHHELKDQGYEAALVGVAISDNVTGPFTYIDSFRIHPGVLPLNFSREQFLNAEIITSRDDEDWKKKVVEGGFFVRDFEGGQMSRDMTLFVDEDQTAYHITASEENQTLLISKLSDDYLSLTKEYIRVFPGGRNEAPAVFKRNNKYYMFTSGLTGWDPNPGKLAVANSIMGEWEMLGNPCVGTPEEQKTTFWSQSTYVLPVAGMKDAFIFIADRWRPKDPIDGRYIWLPILFENNIPYIKWHERWNLDIFKK